MPKNDNETTEEFKDITEYAKYLSGIRSVDLAEELMERAGNIIKNLLVEQMKLAKTDPTDEDNHRNLLDGRLKILKAATQAYRDAAECLKLKKN